MLVTGPPVSPVPVATDVTVPPEFWSPAQFQFPAPSDLATWLLVQFCGSW